jgi:hypothetical protein
MRFIPSILLSFSFIPAPALHAADAAMTIPTLGFVYDAEQSALRRISGTLGAAVIETGAAARLRIGVNALSSEAGVFLAASAEGQLRMIHVSGHETTIETIGEALMPIDRIVLSPSGRAALVYSSAQARVQVLTGLPENPKIAREISTENLGEAIADPAVSDDGQVVLFPGLSLWRLEEAAGVTEVAVGTGTAAVAFRAQSHDAISALRSGDLYRIAQDGTVGNAIRILQQTPAEPLAIQLSADGASAYAVLADGTFGTVNLSTSEVTVVSCGCKPSGLHRVSAGVFRITSDTGLPLLFFDVSTKDPRLRFVPASTDTGDLQESAQ